MGKYASGTEVSVEKSRAEIERTLQRYGASMFGYAWEGPRAVVTFRIQNRHIKFVIQLPDPKDFRFNSRGEMRPDDLAHRLWEQACRQRWRALALVIKAKLECVDCGITTVEKEFLAHIILPDGSTVAEYMAPQIEQCYQSGLMPAGILGLLEPPKRDLPIIDQEV